GSRLIPPRILPGEAGSTPRALTRLAQTLALALALALAPKDSPLARHDEQRPPLERLVLGAQAVDVVVLFDVDHLLVLGHDGQRHAAVAALVDADEQAGLAGEHEVEREVAEGHRHDRVQRVWIAGAHEVAQALVDDVDAAAVVVLRRELLQQRSDAVADA